jgi:hypothetical protein
MELPTFGCDPQHVPDPHLARRFCHLPIRHESVQVTILLSQGTSLEKPRRPKPRIDPHPCHGDIFPRQRMYLLTFVAAVSHAPERTNFPDHHLSNAVTDSKKQESATAVVAYRDGT